MQTATAATTLETPVETRVVTNADMAQYESFVHFMLRKYGITQRRNDYEDYAQDARLGLLAALRTYDESREANFMSYASVCIRNAVFMRKRRKSITSAFSLSDPLPDIDYLEFEGLLGKPDESIERVVEINSMKFDRLSELEKTMIFEVYALDNAQGDVARRHGISQSYVSRLVKRALKKLKQSSEGGR